MSGRTDLIQTTEHTAITHEGDFRFGAPHHFEVLSGNGRVVGTVDFQEGPIGEVGVNGTMNEDLLMMVKMRLEFFQESNFECEENRIALAGVNQAIDALAERTRKRLERGVEGTHVV